MTESTTPTTTRAMSNPLTPTPRKASLFSIRKVNFGPFFMFGFGVGWDKSVPDAAFMLIIGKHILMIGPHYPISKTVEP